MKPQEKVTLAISRIRVVVASLYKQPDARLEDVLDLDLAVRLLIEARGELWPVPEMVTLQGMGEEAECQRPIR